MLTMKRKFCGHQIFNRKPKKCANGSEEVLDFFDVPV